MVVVTAPGWNFRFVVFESAIDGEESESAGDAISASITDGDASESDRLRLRCASETVEEEEEEEARVEAEAEPVENVRSLGAGDTKVESSAARFGEEAERGEGEGEGEGDAEVRSVNGTL